MNRVADCLKGFNGTNPFRDHQARTFNKEKLINEFFPTSKFWSLFNDQHEILVGRRGCGKTILLKMMRYSVLKDLDDKKAKQIISENKYFGIFVPMSLDFLGEFIYQKVSDEKKIVFFQFAFNCMLARSFLHEIKSVVGSYENLVTRGILSRKISQEVGSIWFPDAQYTSFNTIEDLDKLIVGIYESTDIFSDISHVPLVLRNTICRPIQAISGIVSTILKYEDEPTWLVCIDEAEFLPPELQRCINNLFRADSKGIVIKMATLPYYHTTKETLIDGLFAESNGNDFSYRNVDMSFDSDDFVNVTNNLCNTRLRELYEYTKEENITLENFIGKVGNDDLVDYYKAELNLSEIDYSMLNKKIIEQFSNARKISAKKQKNPRKAIYDKFAPIFFIREMYKMSQSGNRIPGWYAGAKSIRKVAEGNPRRFIRLMNVLFEEAKSKELHRKSQHSTIRKFVENDNKAIKSLPLYGPYLSIILDDVGTQLQRKVHGKELHSAGNDFRIDKSQIKANSDLVKWLQLGVAYLYVNVDDDSFFNGITNNTEFSLANNLSAFYWLPMRKGDSPCIKLNPMEGKLPFEVKKC